MIQEFIEFPKIFRLSRECIISEKIDGTNSQIYITENKEFYAGSRNRYLTPENDNHGFAKWAFEHKDELIEGLGIGRHFGEWWGAGIQRKYGLVNDDKRFSLFNTIRWCLHDSEPGIIKSQNPIDPIKYQDRLPKCCGLVPILYRGMFDTQKVFEVLEDLKKNGSKAAPGFMKPEGIVVYHIAGNVGFKKTIEKDDEPKGKNR